MDKESFYTKMKRLGLWDKPISEVANFIDEKDKEIERLKKDSDRYRRLRRMHCNEFQNIYVASLNGNRSFDELVDGIQTFLLDDNMIDDGFGNSWSKTCPMCHMQTMQIVRPGKVQCSICG